jgi:ribosomal protein S10
MNIAEKKTVSKTLPVKKVVGEGKKELSIVFKSYDHTVINKFVSDIIEFLRKEGCEVNGAVAFPTKRSLFTLRSCHFIYKTAAEQYEFVIHKRAIRFLMKDKNIIASLSKISLPCSVEVVIKELF